MSANLPAGACDSHCHVIGPHEAYPLAAGAGDIRSDSVATHLKLLDEVGLSRALVVHPSPAYGGAHDVLLAALAHGGERYRGVAVAHADVSDRQLETWRAAGVCALRFVDVKDAQGRPFSGSAGFADLERLAPRMRTLGLHAQVWADCDTIAANAALLNRLGMPVVFDHMGKPDVAAGAKSPAFARLCAMVREGLVHVKLTLCRNSKQFPHYSDLRPFHDALVDANAAQLVWGSDWPHLRMGALAPDVSHLLDIFCDWIDDEAIRRRILVANPQRLFGFTPIDGV